MLTNGYAILYNRWEENGREQLHKTVLPAVFWQGQEEGGFAGRRYSKKGQEFLAQCLVLIPQEGLPKDKSFLPPQKWLLLPTEDKERFFTFQIGDLLVRGEGLPEQDGQDSLEPQVRRSGQTTTLRRIHQVVTPRGGCHWELEGI